MTRRAERSGVKATETTLRIVEFLHQREHASLNEVANGVGVSTSTAHRHLSTLRENGYIITEAGHHRLSLQFLTHGGRVRTMIPDHELIHRKVRQITKETGERAQFIIEEHGERVYVFTHAGSDAVRTDSTIGKRGPLHVSAAGKAILAHLSDNQLEHILEGISLEPVTQNTITEREMFESELEEVRTQGYAFNDQESVEGLRAVGVPIRYNADSVIGAISVSGPANRMTGEYFQYELPELLLGTVNEIELNLKYS